MVGTLIFKLSCPNLNPDLGHCVVFLWQYTYKYMLLSQCFSSPRCINGCQQTYNMIYIYNAGGDPVID